MKKHFLLLTLLVTLLFTGKVKAQHGKLSRAEFDSLTRMHKYMRGENNDNWGPISMYPRLHVFLKMNSYTAADVGSLSARFGYYGNATLGQLNAVKDIELAVPDITPANAGKYLYHVVMNDSVELVHWTKPTVFRSNKFISYAYLGKIDCFNKIIKVELYEVDNYKNKVTLIFNDGYMPAPKINFVSVFLNNKYLFEPNKLEYIPNSKQKHFQINGSSQQPISFAWSGNINYISVQMTNTLQNDMYQVFLKREIDGKQIFWSIGNNWQQTYYSPNPELHINSSYFKNPGKYTIIVKPKMPDGFKVKDGGAQASATFTVLPGPVSLPIKTVFIIIIIITTTGGFMFMMYRRGQKRKLAAEAKDKQIAALQLASVRAQLNPHFIFNALAGIQNLMNKNDVENANKYLSRFARLTRNVLDDGNKELVSIEQELSLLSDYLLMEQTRFGFQFNMEVDDIDQQIEIPAMLLQPFVENAVKHGVSALNGDGVVKIIIAQKEHTLILAVNDNGKGFASEQTTGMGIKLCNDRIKLLNSIYKNSLILLHKTSDSKGTLITIELRNWV